MKWGSRGTNGIEGKEKRNVEQRKNWSNWGDSVLHKVRGESVTGSDNKDI